jgi:hypothetical protein
MSLESTIARVAVDALPALIEAIQHIGSAPVDQQKRLAERMLAVIASERAEHEAAQALLDARHR